MFEREEEDLKPFKGFFFPASKALLGNLTITVIQQFEAIGGRCTMRCNCDIAHRAGPASHFAPDFVS